ncbi:MAG: lytic transglycosylase domain-containing protein, partial [Betaproteobacteria bacterium]|nr:lytic transglycosylase domain-containing protein [Betaproteobacteria bacterium]
MTVRLLALLALLAPSHALGGNQVYERLSESVRASMQASLAERSVPFLNFGNPADAQKWVYEMSARLRQRMPDRKQRFEFLKTVHHEALRARLDPQLVLGLIEVESGFRKYAVSSAGARGYMQVMPFWVREIGEPKHNLFSLRTNLRYGCLILRHYLDIENGDYFRALGRYNGSLGRTGYPTLVHAHW